VTRFSIDFRTVSIADLADRIGAVNVDCACTGTTLRDFVRCTTLERLPDDVIAPYDDDSSKEYTTLVYEPTTD
jgi:hypothetical protein